MRRNCLLYCLLGITLVSQYSCQSPEPKEAEAATMLFEVMDKTGIDFQNNVEDGKLENSFLFRNFYNGGGVGIADINNDGLPDVFMTSNAGANKLYLNKGNFQFEDISDKAGIIKDDKWNTGVVLADINADGWLDIYVSSSGHMSNGNRKNKLYINNKDLTFTEAAAAYGLDISAYTTQTSFFDYDLDGDLDCFMINNSPIPVNQLGFANRRDLPDKDWPVAEFLKGGGDHLYRNDNGHFTEVTKQAGIHGSLISFGLGVSVADINLDGYPDVFVSNDSYERDYLYINQKDGTFKDELEHYMQHVSFSSMGADIADINNDGYPDLFSTDMLPYTDLRVKTTGSFDNIDLFNSKLKAGFYYQYVQNCLHLNNGDGSFSDIANYSGVAASDWSWGALMFDMDNDGWNDLYVCNGVNRDVTNLDFMDFFANETYQKMVMTGKKNEIDEILKEIPRTPLPNRVYRNNKDLGFTEVSAAWGLGQPSFSNGAAYADLDNDGDLDLIVSTENQPSIVYRNNSNEINKFHYLSLALKGKGKNPFAVGSRIIAYAGTQVLSREVIPSRGFQSSVDYKTIIGLGDINAVDSMLIIWPDRSFTHIDKPQVDKELVIQQDDPKNSIDEWPVHKPSTYFSNVANTPFTTHKEDQYIDFYVERNVPRKISTEGPATAAGDLNGDGLDDVFIGGAAGSPAHIYLQTDRGFIEKSQTDFRQFEAFEDVTATFFDCDGDGDLDLFVGAGGNIALPNSREIQHRLFKNDGKGNFKIDVNAFPPNNDNSAIALAYDFDMDGDEDLFVGARNVTQQYGTTPESHVYINDGVGHFTAMDQSLLAGIDTCGMVTGAVWANLKGDGERQLVIVGEWMEPQVYVFKKFRFERVTTDLQNMYGWWQSVAAADLNGDGKEDLILGNVGENCYLRPDVQSPVKLWINDFDQNNMMDKVVTSTVDGRDLPVFLKRDLTDQVPGLKKQNLLHGAYATKSIEELFSSEALDKSLKRQFNYASSCIAISNGDGHFAIQKLPARMQLSSVNALYCTDINADGKTDILAAGNLFCYLPQFERLDASYGDLLLNDGKGNFTWKGSTVSGVHLRGEVKHIVYLKGKNANYFLYTQNNAQPVLYKQEQIN